MKWYSLSVFLLLLSFSACETIDVDPIINTSNNSKVSISASATNIAEDGGVSQIILTLNELSASEVTVYLKYTGTATFDKDYSANLSVSIPAGSSGNQTTLLALADTIKEGNEAVIITIDSVIGGQKGTSSVQITIEDDDVSGGGNLIFNEILYDPSNTALEGDANGDGVYAQAEDEFIEFYNNSSKPLNMGGYKIFDASALSSGTPRHTIPSGTILAPYKALVVFGGGNPTGTFGNAIVQKSTTGDLNMNNAGDMVTVQDSLGNVVLTFDITPLSDNPNESYTRSPDVVGDFVQHASTPSGAKFSPGTKIDKSPF